MPRLFISHSSRDNFEALAFRDWLISEDWALNDIFLDLHGLGAGERWKDALAKANECCEAVVLLASPVSLASTECRVELRMAEDYGKEIVVAILHLLTPDSQELGPYRERQIVDLSIEPRDATFTVTHEGQQKAIAFHRPTLARIKARLDQLGISPTSFAWRLGDLSTASPYPGLKGFEAGEAALFFGRAADIARGLSEIRKLRRMAAGQILVIQAASGAGKSSFLKAGLWPRLARDPEFVPLAMLRPATGILTGDNGIGRQFAAFFAARDPAAHRALNAATIHQELRKSDAAARAYLAGLINAATELGHAAQRLANPDAPPPTPLIAVDQAEELFAASDLEESTRFLRLFAGLIDPHRPDSLKLTAAPQLIWTVRADSMDALLHATESAGLKPPALFPLPPIPRDAYRDIIATPLQVANTVGMKLAIDPLLVDALVVKSTGADALPLLAFTLRQLLADHRAGAAANLTLESFEAAGGMEGVLAARLAAAQRAGGGGPDALRLLFLPHLCTWDADANPPGAKRLIAREADLLSGPRAGLAPLIEALVNERLLTRSGDASGAATLEVAHEALLRQPPISDWLEADREFLIWREGVARARAAFEANRRGLLIGRELEIARGWVETRAEDAPTADRAFIEESAAADEARRREEEDKERQYREAELRVAKEREVAARRVARRTMAGLLVALLLALVAGGAGVWAGRQQQIAEEQRETAIRQQQIAEEQREAAIKQSQRAEQEVQVVRIFSDQFRESHSDTHTSAERDREFFKRIGDAAARGNIAAARTLGLLFFDGRGVAKDYAKAREWSEKAAAAGDAGAMRNTAILYVSGLGGPQDYSRARQLYEKAAAAGDPAAMTGLGTIYDNGLGVAINYIKAREWFEKAASAGDAEAMRNLGVHFETGRGVTQDYSKAHEWYEKGAANGNIAAMTNLGLLYFNGFGVTQDYIRAREWFQKAASTGDTEAMNNLGVLYENGLGLEKDNSKAREWFEKASEKEHPGNSASNQTTVTAPAQVNSSTRRRPVEPRRPEVRSLPQSLGGGIGVGF